MNPINLVCTGTASAIALANPSQLLTLSIGGLAPGSSVNESLVELPLWRYARITYVSTSGLTSPDDVSITLQISGINQGGPWLGGELSPTNANACSTFSCNTPYCMGPVETGRVVVTNVTAGALPAVASIIIRVTFEYPGLENSARPQVPEQSCHSCGGGVEDIPEGMVPVYLPADIARQLESQSEVEVARALVRGDYKFNCRSIAIPGKFDPATGKHGSPVGGVSCKKVFVPS